MPTISTKEFFKAGNVKRVGSDGDNFIDLNDNKVIEDTWEKSQNQGTGVWDGLVNDFQKRASNIWNISQDNKSNFIEKSYQGAGQVAAATGDIVGRGLQGAFRLLPDSIEKPIAEAGKSVIGAIAGSKSTQDTLSAYEQWKKSHPEAAANLESTVNIAGGLLGSGITKSAGSSAVGLAEKAAVEAGTLAKSATKGFGGVLSDIADVGVLKTATKSAGERLGITNKILDKAGDVSPSLSTTVIDKAKTNPGFKGLIEEAAKQGFSEKDINFLSSVGPKDKPVLRKMYDLTVKAQSDPRQVTRAADVLGDTVTGQVKQVQGLNAQAGKAVDMAAKSLKGQAVDVAPIRDYITARLDDAGIKIAEDGTLDFENSVFKNTPLIQKEIQKVVSSAPSGEDAYQLHIFKKSIDELVNYGTGGEGLRGTSANILKGIRNATDDVLDNTFQNYNAANSSFKLTRDFIDQAKEIVGKNVDLGTKEGSQAFGQALRSAFSNNKSRGNVLKFIEELQNTGSNLGLKGSGQNVLDQALFVNILEDTFGSQAATGLAGEVGKAIKKVQTVAGVIRNPLTGTLNVLADTVEKARNITPEAKKQVIDKFINDALETAAPVTKKPSASVLKKINDALGESVPGLYTKSTYNVSYTTKEGKKAVLKNLTREDAKGWLQWLEENKFKYSVKLGAAAATAGAVAHGQK